MITNVGSHISEPKSAHYVENLVCNFSKTPASGQSRLMKVKTVRRSSQQNLMEEGILKIFNFSSGGLGGGSSLQF